MFLSEGEPCLAHWVESKWPGAFPRAHETLEKPYARGISQERCLIQEQNRIEEDSHKRLKFGARLCDNI